MPERLHPYPNPQEDPQFYPGEPRSDAERSQRASEAWDAAQNAAGIGVTLASGLEFAPLVAAGRVAVGGLGGLAAALATRMQGRAGKAPRPRPMTPAPRGVSVSPADWQATERNVSTKLERSAQGRGAEAAPPARQDWRQAWQEERDFFKEYLKGTIQQSRERKLGGEEELEKHLAEWEKPMDFPFDDEGWRRMYLMQKRANDNLKRLQGELGKIQGEGQKGLRGLEGELTKLKAEPPVGQARGWDLPPPLGGARKGPQRSGDADIDALLTAWGNLTRREGKADLVPPSNSPAWREFEDQMRRLLVKSPRKPYTPPKVVGEGKHKPPEEKP